MLFKKKLLGKDYADGLIHKVSRDVYENWGIFQNQMAEALNQNEAEYEKFSEGYAPLIIVAVIMVDMQAIRTLRSENDFISLRRHVLTRLGDALGNKDVEELFDIYQTSWDQAIERNENPLTFGVASALYDALEIPHSLNDVCVFQSPRILKVLGDFIMPVIGFTKFALKSYKVKVE